MNAKASLKARTARTVRIANLTVKILVFMVLLLFVGEEFSYAITRACPKSRILAIELYMIIQ